MRALILPHDKRCFCFVCIPCLPIGLSSYPFFIRKIISTNYYRLSCGELAFILYSELNIGHDLKPFKLQVAVALAQSTTGDSLEDSSEFNFMVSLCSLNLFFLCMKSAVSAVAKATKEIVGSLALLLACWGGYIASWKKKRKVFGFLYDPYWSRNAHPLAPMNWIVSVLNQLNWRNQFQ